MPTPTEEEFDNAIMYGEDNFEIHNLSFDYTPENPIITLDISREQMQKFAQNELKSNSLDSDAYQWLLTEATQEQYEQIKHYLLNEIWTILVEKEDLFDGLYEAYCTGYHAR